LGPKRHWRYRRLEPIVERDKIKLPGVVVGVIDVGFYDHEDLSFLHPTSGMAIDDHGNHVAGILCAKHNGLGVRGVLPDCLVVARSGDFLPIASEGVDDDQFMLVFSQILMAMERLIPLKPVSLHVDLPLRPIERAPGVRPG
jgi:hypothetical protein